MLYVVITTLANMYAWRIRSHLVPIFIAVLLLVGGVPNTNASAQDSNPVIHGTPCAKAGTKYKVGRIAYICVLIGKRRVWTPADNTSSSKTTTSVAARPITPVLTRSPVNASDLFCAPEAHISFNSEYFFCFEPFGTIGTEPDGRQKRMPHYTYRLKGGAKIYASADGTVSDIIYQESHRDFELHLDLGDMLWLLVYDHVDRVLVPKGAKVRAGDVVAEINPITENAGFEFQVNVNSPTKIPGRIDPSLTYHICPQSLGSQAFKDFHLSVLRLNNAVAPSPGFETVCTRDTVTPETFWVK